MGEHDDKHEDHGGGGGHGGGGHGGGGHGGGGGHAEGEHEGAPEWLISFADNVALLMGFFVILLAMNMAPKSDGPAGGTGQGGTPDSRMIDFVIGIREAFNTPFNINSKASADQPFIKRIQEKKGGMGASEGPSGRFAETTSTGRGQRRNVAASIAFDDGSASLRPGAKITLGDVARHLRDQGWIVDVRGHVSPFEARNFEQAMTLSKDRATVVANALIEAGVKAANLRLVLCADHDRMVPRAFDAEASRTNQRVEIVVTNEPVPADPHAVTKTKTGGDAEAHAGAEEEPSADEGEHADH